MYNMFNDLTLLSAFVIFWEHSKGIEISLYLHTSKLMVYATSDANQISKNSQDLIQN